MPTEGVVHPQELREDPQGVDSGQVDERSELEDPVEAPINMAVRHGRASAEVSVWTLLSRVT